VEIEAALEFVRAHHNAVLATYRADGSPQLSPVTAGVDGDQRVVISTRETAFKVRNARRDPRVSLCVLPDGFYGPWVQLSGEADVVSLPDAMEFLVAYYRGISGEHPDWDDYRQAMIRDQRCVVRITVRHAGPDRSG
jgi:PPOX class probable F420-dependent enzyme